MWQKNKSNEFFTAQYFFVFLSNVFTEFVVKFPFQVTFSNYSAQVDYKETIFCLYLKILQLIRCWCGCFCLAVHSYFNRRICKYWWKKIHKFMIFMARNAKQEQLLQIGNIDMFYLVKLAFSAFLFIPRNFQTKKTTIIRLNRASRYYNRFTL